MKTDVTIIAIASCSLFIIGIGLWWEISAIKDKLDKILEALQSRPSTGDLAK
jgi:hypothetical protein